MRVNGDLYPGAFLEKPSTCGDLILLANDNQFIQKHLIVFSRATLTYVCFKVLTRNVIYKREHSLGKA